MKKLLRWMRIATYTALLIIAVLGGMFGTLFIGKIAETNENRPCYVPGYVTMACTRLENETHYLYTVIAVRGTDTVAIQYTVSKLRKIYL